MIVNQFSYVLIAIFLVGVASIIVWRVRRVPRWLSVGVVALALVVVWLVARPTATAEVNSLADAEGLIGTGKPTIVEFLSEY